MVVEIGQMLLFFCWLHILLVRICLVPIGELDQLADRPFSIREVPGSKPGFSIFVFCFVVLFCFVLLFCCFTRKQ